MEEVKIIHDHESFEMYVLDSKKPVLVDFYATWCGPCKILAPELENVARHYGDKAVIAKVNTDEYAQLARQFQVRGVPTIIFFKEGIEVNRVVGFRSSEELITILDKL